MRRRRLALAALLLGLVLGAAVPLTGQDTLSQQVLRLLVRDNTWTGVQTFASTVGLTLQRGLIAPTLTTDRLYNVGGNLYFNGVLVATSAGAGTVTSVALTAPAIFSVAGSPVTSSGTLALSLATETANRVWAGPTTGSAATPTFRALVDDDIPDTISINSSGTVTWASVSKAGSSLADLATASAGDLTSGTLPSGVFPATLPTASGVNLTALNATQLTSGTIPDGRFPATLPALDGSALTNLSAANLGSGTVGCGFLPALTGDITTTAGFCATTLALTAVTPASYGDATHVATFTVDAKGRLTAAANVAVTFPTVDLSTGITGTLGILHGGTGLTSNPVDGELLIGSGGSGFVLANLVGTGGITVTNGAGTITLGLSLGTTSTPQFARIGLGTAAGASAVLTTTGQFDLGLSANGNCGSAQTVNWNNGQIQSTTLNAATCTLTYTNPIVGATYRLLVIQDGTGGRLVTWPGTVTWVGGAAPVLSTAASATDVCRFTWNGSAYYGACDVTSLGLNALQATTVTLTNAQVLALPTTPVTIVSAAGSGKALVFVGADVKGSFTGAGYTNVNATSSSLYFDDSTAQIGAALANDSAASPTVTDMTTFLTTTGTRRIWMSPKETVPSTATATWGPLALLKDYAAENLPIRLAATNNSAGVWTGGNVANSMTVTVYYLVR